MKTNLLLLFLLGWAGMVFCQEINVKEGGNYYFNYPSKENLDNLKNETDLKEDFSISNIQDEIEGTKFRIQVRKINKNKVYFIFGKFSDVDLNRKINGSSNEELTPLTQYQEYLEGQSIRVPENLSSKIKDGKKILYSLSLEEFKIATKPLYDRIDWRVGAYTIPFKLRFGDFTFDANVNLGANIGAKIRWNREIENGFALEPIFGFGLASIKLDESNSANISAATNVSAFTVNTGVLIHVTNTINVGITYGYDKISKNDQNNYNWKYNSKGWLGLGINIAFSNQGSNTGEKATNP